MEELHEFVLYVYKASSASLHTLLSTWGYLFIDMWDIARMQQQFRAIPSHRLRRNSSFRFLVGLSRYQTKGADARTKGIVFFDTEVPQGAESWVGVTVDVGDDGIGSYHIVKYE